MTTLVTGATGLVGSRLVTALLARGDRVVAVSRRPGTIDDGRIPVIADPTRPGPWLEQVTAADAVVHLAGAGVFDRRWTTAYKAAIRDSRVDSTAVLARALAENPFRTDGRPKSFLSASAVGYYGSTDSPCDETAPAGNDFLARVCVAWEEATGPAKAAGVRVVIPRVCVVLDPAGGALAPLLRLFRWFLGGPVGTGRQWVSWAHRDDLTAILLHLLDSDSIAGPVNTAAPGAVRNADFCRTIGRVLRRPSWMPAPRLAVRLAIGEAATVATGGQKAIPRRLSETGFHWNFPDLEPALRDLLGRPAG